MNGRRTVHGRNQISRRENFRNVLKRSPTFRSEKIFSRTRLGRWTRTFRCNHTGPSRGHHSITRGGGGAAVFGLGKLFISPPARQGTCLTLRFELWPATSSANLLSKIFYLFHPLSQTKKNHFLGFFLSTKLNPKLGLVYTFLNNNTPHSEQHRTVLIRQLLHTVQWQHATQWATPNCFIQTNCSRANLCKQSIDVGVKDTSDTRLYNFKCHLMTRSEARQPFFFRVMTFLCHCTFMSVRQLLISWKFNLNIFI